MRLLLDTHTFLWFVLGDSQCSQTARELIEDEANEKWLSRCDNRRLPDHSFLVEEVSPGRSRTGTAVYTGQIVSAARSDERWPHRKALM